VLVFGVHVLILKCFRHRVLKLFKADLAVLIFVFLHEDTLPGLRKVVIHISGSEHLLQVLLGNVAFLLLIEKIEHDLNVLVVEQFFTVISRG